MRRRTTRLVLAALAAGALFGACSQQDDPTVEELREDISVELQEIQPLEGEELSADEAECYAELLVPGDPAEKVEDDDLTDVRFSDAEPSDELAERIAEAAVEARTECLSG